MNKSLNLDIRLVSALCKKYGKQISGGGFEISIPFAEVSSISRSGEVQQVPDPHSVKLVYYPKITIDGEVVPPVDITPTK